MLEIARAYHNPGSHIDNYTKNLEIVKNLERIGDLNLNLVGFFHLMNQNNETFTDLAIEELDLMIKGLLDILTETLIIFSSQDTSTLERMADHAVNACRFIDNVTMLHETKEVL